MEEEDTRKGGKEIVGVRERWLDVLCGLRGYVYLESQYSMSHAAQPSTQRGGRGGLR